MRYIAKRHSQKQIDWLIVAGITLVLLVPMAAKLYQQWRYISRHTIETFQNASDLREMDETQSERVKIAPVDKVPETAFKTRNAAYQLLATLLAVETVPAAEPEPVLLYSLTDEEKTMIAVIAKREVVGPPSSDDSGKIDEMARIVQVVINRVIDGRFGGTTVTDVIYAKGQFGTKRFIGRDIPSENALKAVENVCMGLDPFEGANVLYAFESWRKPSSIARGLVLVETVGGTSYYKQD